MNAPALRDFKNVCTLWNDGCYGRGSQGAWSCNPSDDRIHDRGLWTTSSLDFYVFPDGCVSFRFFSVYDLSGILDSYRRNSYDLLSFDS